MNKIETIIDQQFDEFINELKELISIPSVYTEDDSKFPFGEAINQALRKTLSVAESLGFKTYYDPDGYYGYADYGTGEEMIGVLGHLDVVPAGDLNKWETNPFQGTIKDNKIYGRGTQDDKGPTLAALYGFKAVVDSGEIINKKVRFIFGIDEETLWRSISKYVEKEEMPKYSFTPDANFPLIFAEKGLLQVNFVGENKTKLRFKGGDAYNAVPSQMTIETKEKQELCNALQTLGFEHNCQGNKVTTLGKSVHAKDSDKGINAISRMLMATKEIGWNSKAIEFINEEIKEDALAKKIFGECSDEASGALKFNIGKVELNESQEILNIDIRIPVTVSKEFVWDKLVQVSQKHGFEIVENDYLKSIYTPLDSPLVKSLMSSYTEITNDTKNQPVSSGGATYARAVDNCVAFGASFPTTKETEHQPNEYIKLEELKLAMKVYANAFKKLLKI